MCCSFILLSYPILSIHPSIQYSLNTFRVKDPVLHTGDTVMSKTGPALGTHRLVNPNLGVCVKEDGIVEAGVRPQNGPREGMNHMEQRWETKSVQGRRLFGSERVSRSLPCVQ